MVDTYLQPLDFGSNFFRIAWLGNLASLNRGHQWTSPSVCVVLVKVELNGTEFIACSAELREVWISIGQLPLLHVGDIWHRGIKICSTDDCLENFDNLEISAQTVSTIKAGVSDENGSFYLPLLEHDAHQNHTQSYCALIQLPDQRQIVLPCWELIRFYFGTAGTVLGRLVKPNLTKQQFFSDFAYHAPRGHLRIQLAPGIPGNAASDIGRLALSKIAWSAALRIASSCLKASTSKERIYPHTHFPFEGKTTLTAAGRWISHGGRERSTFVVSYLKQCTHPFPFQSLRYELDIGIRLAKQRAEMNAGTAQEKIQRVSKPSPNPRIGDGDPSKYKKPVSRTENAQPRFPDLETKEVWRSVEVKPAATAEGSMVPKAAENEIESTGDPVSSTKTRAVDISLSHVIGYSRKRLQYPAFLRTALKMHPFPDSAKLQLIYLENSDDACFHVPAVVDEDGVINESSWFQSRHRKQRMRLAVALLFYVDTDVSIVLVVEPTSAEEMKKPLLEIFAWQKDLPINLDQMQQLATLVVEHG